MIPISQTGREAVLTAAQACTVIEEAEIAPIIKQRLIAELLAAAMPCHNLKVGSELFQCSLGAEPDQSISMVEIARRVGAGASQLGNLPERLGVHGDDHTAVGDAPATYEELQAGYEAMRDHCNAAFDGWRAERRKLWSVEAAMREALRWLEAEGNTGTGYVNRIWGAKKALARARKSS